MFAGIIWDVFSSLVAITVLGFIFLMGLGTLLLKMFK